MKNSFDKVAEQFANLMISKIETISTNWEKPWFPKFSNSQNCLPQNLSGRIYAGGNAFLLLLLCEELNYQTPVFLTFNQARNENISILKGSKSFPVYYTMFCAYHRETGEKITLDEFKTLSKEEQKEYRLVGINKAYAVFNLDQTNFSEKHPEKWEVLKAKFTTSENPISDVPQMYKNTVLDSVLSSQSWVCPIHLKAIDQAFYAPLADSISMPLKEQFKDGQAFYATMLHEMAHSTGIATRLNRDKFCSPDKKDYGREELVADLTAGLCSLFFGISTGIREENAQYLKGWIKNIKEESKYLLSVLSDSMKAVKYMAEKLDLNINQIADETQIKEAV
jgi:antirestriction protein ArdC